MVSLLDPSPQTHPLFSVSLRQYPLLFLITFLFLFQQKVINNQVTQYHLPPLKRKFILEGGLKQKTFYSFQEWFNLETTGKKYRKI